MLTADFLKALNNIYFWFCPYEILCLIYFYTLFYFLKPELDPPKY